MIKALRITSIIAVIASVLAVVLVVFPAVFGVKSDEQIEQFLNSAGAIDRFNEAKGDRTKTSSSQILPLVKQAQAFALYLNPPPKPKPRRVATTRKPPPKRRPTGPVAAKFKLIGTSFYALHPERSFALIDEPGKGLSWVRQSGKLGHLIIEQVKDGLVVVRDGQRTFELTPERPVRRSLLKPAKRSFLKEDKQSPDTDLRLPLLESEDKKSKINRSKIESQKLKINRSKIESQKLKIKSRPPQLSAEETDAMGKFMDKMKTMQADVGPGGTKKTVEAMGKLISDLRAMRIGDEEAKRLDHLGKELKASPMDVNAEPNHIEDDEAENPASSSEPNTSEEE